MKKLLPVALPVLILIFILGWKCTPADEEAEARNNPENIEELSVQSVLMDLGDEPPRHYISSIDHKKAEAGRLLIHEGSAPLEMGGTGKRISRYFVCTDCHNTVREHVDIAADLPEDRLEYCMENGLPYKPGSTFWGITNRIQFYTNDYVKKYGEFARKARDTLENAVQLCATDCSSGRLLTHSELEAIMHYLHSLQLTISDLGLSEETMNVIAKRNSLDKQSKSDLIDRIKDSYNHMCMATFTDPIPVDERKYGENGDPEKGRYIYESGCMFCHAPNRVTNFEIVNDEVNMSFFSRKMKGTSDYSIYEIIREGTVPIVGRRQYMPFYTMEKMSDRQIEHLAAFINQTQ